MMLENQLGGAGTALIIGAVTLVGYLLFARRAEARTAATCTVDPVDGGKLDRWANARGFPLFYFPNATTPPTLEEYLAQVSEAYGGVTTVLAPGEQAVAVLGDGSFWYYTTTEGPGRADNLRADYCSFEG